MNYYSNHLSIHKKALDLLDAIISREGQLLDAKSLISRWTSKVDNAHLMYDLPDLEFDVAKYERYLRFAKRNYAVLSGQICQGGLPVQMEPTWVTKAEADARENFNREAHLDLMESPLWRFPKTYDATPGFKLPLAEKLVQKLEFDPLLRVAFYAPPPPLPPSIYHPEAHEDQEEDMQTTLLKYSLFSQRNKIT